MRTFGSGVAAYATAALPVPPDPFGFDTPSAVVVNAGQVVRLQHFTSLAAIGGAPGVEIQIFSAVNFENRNETTAIGSQQFTGSRYPSTNSIIFSLTDSQWASLASGDPVRVQYGKQSTNEYWDCGVLNKSQLIL